MHNAHYRCIYIHNCNIEIIFLDEIINNNKKEKKIIQSLIYLDLDVFKHIQ